MVVMIARGKRGGLTDAVREGVNDCLPSHPTLPTHLSYSVKDEENINARMGGEREIGT